MSDFALVSVSDAKDLEICKSIRRRVFIDEQGVDESLELDEHDVLGGKCRHFYAAVKGIPAGACRVMDKGEGIAKLQRFCVLSEFRMIGVGRFMLEKLEQICCAQEYKKIEMGAQCHAVPFYEKCGYSVVSGVFLDAGIEHVKMEKYL
jgi:Predicted acyltransferase